MRVNFEKTGVEEIDGMSIWFYQVEFSEYLYKHYDNLCFEHVKNNCGLPFSLFSKLPIHIESYERGVVYTISIKINNE